MGCDFTLNHYREILENALNAGYIFWHFHKPFPELHQRVIYLRHDLDICLEEAIPMAELEADIGISSTFFILINSPVYNPLSAENLEIIRTICSKGHHVGLHIDVNLWSDNCTEFEHKVLQLLSFYGSYIPLVPVVSFHRPPASILGKDFKYFISTYSAEFFQRSKYLSDSRGEWREGCPCRKLREGAYSVLQILVHPIWWGNESKSQRLRALLNRRFLCFDLYLKENIQVDWGEG